MPETNDKILPIRIYGDPVLRRKAEQIKDIDGEVAGLAEQMIASLQKARGLGLAAPQVGRSRAMCIINLPALDEKHKKPLVLINPQVVMEQDRIIYQEGCLSFPGLYAEIERPAKVGVKGLDLDGKELEYQADEFLARVFQHEIDHLNGVLFIDRLSPIKRQLLKKQLRELSLKSKETSDV
jgi:peptide deformylase